MLRYALYSNELTKDNPNDQVARPVEVVRRNKDHLIKQINRGGSIVKASDFKAHIENYWMQIRDYIAEGETYDDEFMGTRFDVSGVFEDVDDTFSPDRHHLVVSIRLKPLVSEAAQGVVMRKVERPKTNPEVTKVYDWGSETENEKLTPGGALEIKGLRLKIYDNVAEEGVYFVNKTSGAETKATAVRTNEPQNLSLKVPALSAGNYQLEVRNTTHSSKTLRIAIFTIPLVVA